MKILITIILVLVAWTAWGYFSSNVEQTEYTVIEKKNGYEIRMYPSHIVAQTEVDGQYDSALNKGFSIVAGYIFGGNTKKTSIAMTSPVQAENQSYEKIAMTAPVVVDKAESKLLVSFGMPKSYTLETLPTPNDSRVKLVSVPVKKVAVIKFSFFRGENRIKKMEGKLTEFLERDSLKKKGMFSYAGYNAPWTPPWMTRNEVLVEIE